MRKMLSIHFSSENGKSYDAQDSVTLLGVLLWKAKHCIAIMFYLASLLVHILTLHF